LEFCVHISVYDESTDAVLIERTLKGDKQAFAELVRRYQATVWRTVHRLLGNSSEKEDAVQETFLRAFVSLGKFNPKYSFVSWVLSIAVNYCIDQLRKRKSKKIRLWSELGKIDQERLLQDFTQAGGVESSETAYPESYVEEARLLLDKLNPKYKAAFVLREIDDREYGEVAEILRTTEINARVRVSRARSELRKGLARIVHSENDKK